jgi:anti-sigma B factor antagonist
VAFFYFSDDATFEDAVPADVFVLPMGGEIDYAASPELKDRILRAIKSGKRHLVLDLSAVSFIDSTAIGVLVGGVTKLQDAGGGSLAVVCGNRNVLQIFELTGLEGMIALHGSREEALAALAVAG